MQWLSIIVVDNAIGKDISFSGSISEASYGNLFESAGYPNIGDIPLLNRKIFKGVRVSVQEHPYVVSVRRLLSHYLTGSLLTRKLVITVAHPLFNVPIYELGVVAGQTYSDRGTTLRSVILVILHEEFDPYTLNADVALLRLYEEFVFRISVKPIALIAPSSNLNDERAFVTGWGRCDLTGKELCLPRSTKFFPDEKIDPMMRTISFVITSPNYYCEGYERHETRLKPGMMCLGIAREENAVTPCLAVPGAPLVIDGHLAGLQSWGFGCGYQNDLPLIYTDMRHFQPWILHNVPILRNLTQYNLTEMFQATRAYSLSKWLTLTRENFEPLTLTFADKPILQSDLDKELAKLKGTVFDIRDFIYSGEFHLLKSEIFENIRNSSNHEIRNISSVFMSITTKPFLNKDKFNDEDDSSDFEDIKNSTTKLNTNESDTDESQYNNVKLQEFYI
ncbi:trypsin epsilon [Papilio machaon]|uniref:trypsin epsilon n=1 Tax=Papilio machaon TaxID=76193 RepID=UPI001E6660CA|nr:trypsin epsilon [Papilio machaon]